MFAISCGIINNKIYLDLDYNEDSSADADANFVFNNLREIIEIQCTGEKKPISAYSFQKCLKYLRNLCIIYLNTIGDFKGVNIKIILASHNINKLDEFNKIFKPYDVSFLPISEITNLVPEETGKTFSENAIIKAKQAGQQINWKLPCLADDSGLSIKILSNRPGVYSARWAINNSYTNVFKYIRKKIEAKGRSHGRTKSF